MNREWKWLDPSLSVDWNTESRKLLDTIDGMRIPNAQKNMLVQYYIEHPHMQRKANRQKEIRSWMRTDAYQKIKEQRVHDDQNKFTIASIVIVMMATLFLFFLRAVITRSFVVNFSVDAIVGAIALVLLVRNLHIKYRLIDQYVDTKRWYQMIDGASFVLCVLLKFLFPPVFDFSLILLFISFVIQKKKLEKIFQSF